MTRLSEVGAAAIMRTSLRDQDAPLPLTSLRLAWGRGRPRNKYRYAPKQILDRVISWRLRASF